MMELRARPAVGFDALRPMNDTGGARAAKVGGNQFGALERRITGPSPAVMVHIFQQGTANRIQTAVVALQHFHLFLYRAEHGILRQQFGNGAVHPFGRCAIIGIDVDDDRVFEKTLRFQFGHDFAVLGIGMFQKTGIHFHEPGLEGALFFRYIFPFLHRGIHGGQFGVFRNPAEFFLPFEGFFAERFPSLVEFAFVFVGPFLGHVMRPMHGAGGKVEEERVVGGVGQMVADEGFGSGGHIFGQMVLRVVRRLDGIDVFKEARLIL